MSDRFSDVADATLRMSVTFKAHGMTPPTAILLDNKQDAYSILYAARQENCEFMINPQDLNPTNVHEFDGKPCGMMELYGIKFYWPLEKIAKPSGGFYYG